MLRPWVESYTPKPSIAPVVTVCTLAHAIVIAVWVIATLPAPNVPVGSIANRTYYVPPPDKVRGAGAPHEVVRYIALGPEEPGIGGGPGVAGQGQARPVTPDEGAGHAQVDTMAVREPAAPATVGDTTSVFTVLDVDTAVVRSSSSAAPAYPPKMLAAHIMGSVSARYVVDTTGFADSASFTVISSTHREFIDAVREALPHMRFQPAKIGPLKVRQLVEQQFTFRISDTVVVAPRVKKP